MIFVLPLGLAIIAWTVFLLFFAKDRSRYRNCYLLCFALGFSVLTIAFLFGEDYAGPALLAILLAFALAVMIVPFFLIHNGIVMMKREGKSLANLLSLFFGILIGLGEITTFALFFSAFMDLEGEGILQWIITKFGGPMVLFSISVVYVSVSFLVFMIYTLFLQIIPKKKDFDYIIIHGAGLLQGNRVSKLLSDRIDKALEVYRRDPTPPILIPSGGQGANETESEARAMADYLLEKGIPEDKIILEDQSTTTYENLTNSKKIIEGKGKQAYTALVTSNYHVYRAMRYAKKIGLYCTGIGSHVAFYYWPSALIREYIAIHAEPKHLIIFVAGWLFFLSPFLFTFFS